MDMTEILGLFGLGAQIAGGLGATYAAYRKSSGEQEGYYTQAQVGKNNAQIAEWQAADAVARGRNAADLVKLKGRALTGTQEAMIAARGVATNEGSALNILADTDYLTARDAAITMDNANKEAWALREQATGFVSNAGILSNRGDAQSPFLDAGGTALTALGRVASSWYAMRSKTVGGSGLSLMGSP